MISNTETLGGSSLTLIQIEPLCAGYDAECVKLEDMIGGLEADLEAVKQKHLAALKRQARVVANREAELHSAVETSPALFVKPRTYIMHGTKVGLASSIGSVVFEDEAQVVKLVEKHFKERFDELVKTEYTPRKDSLRQLTEAELAKLGCAVDGAGEVVIVKRVAGDVEKLINKLITKLVEAMVESEVAA